MILTIIFHEKEVACVLTLIVFRHDVYIYILFCTFKVIMLLISGDRFKFPINSNLREGFTYKETAVMSSLRCP